MQTIIHNQNREEILKTINQIKNGVCLEIGVLKGHYSKKILEQNPKMLYIVDAWMPLENYEDETNNKNHPNAFIEAKIIADLYSDKCVMIKAKSTQAVEIFKDNFFDFIYIDANHSYEEVKKDINNWFPKVKSGGILGGHDYLKLNWEAGDLVLNNKKDKVIYRENGMIKGGGEKCLNKNNKLGIFGVNPAVNEFCSANNYTLNSTSDFFANWWIIK